MSISTQTFNPHRTPTERLVGLTVGREGLLRRIIESLKASAVGDAMPQWLVTGQRGMGKTHLLLYLFNLVRSEEILSRQWEVLHLREEEYWKTHSAATFVRLLVQRLAARESQASEDDQSPLTVVADELMTMPSSQEMFNRARAALDRFARTSGRRILVGAENLDALFHQFRDPLVEGRMLRDILQHGSLSLIGTSITTELGSDLDDNKNPLYRLFRIEPLARFTFEQQEMQLQRLADLEEDDTARKKVTSFLRENKSSLQVIHRLSGGNPRLGVILYGVLAGPGRVLESIDLLHSLLDINTPYFQDRIKDLAPLERPLAAAFCEAETTLTGAEAARLTGQDRNKVYSLLARLRKAGFIEAVEWAARPGRRGNHYQVAEDLLRMWWQYRFDQQSLVRKIVEFLTLVYDRDELEDANSARGFVDRLLSLQDQPGGSALAGSIFVAKAGAADLEEVVGLVAERLAAAEHRDQDSGQYNPPYPRHRGRGRSPCACRADRYPCLGRRANGIDRHPQARTELLPGNARTREGATEEVAHSHGESAGGPRACAR